MSDPKRVELGTLISGTLVTEELVRAFADELERVAPADAADDLKLVTEAREWLDMDEDQGERGGEWKETGGYLVDELQTKLEDYAPPFCYFGTNEGDGADFGWLVSEDALDEAIRDQTVLPCLDAPRRAGGREIPEYVLHVSDHGNRTLYRVATTQEW